MTIELNETWRKKYMHRFFGGDVNFDDDNEDAEFIEERTAETITTDDLKERNSNENLYRS